MSETTTVTKPKGTTKQKAAAAGAKLDEGHQPDLAPKIKALQAEAAEGDVVVAYRGDTFTLHVESFQNRMADDYEFMEQVTSGILPVMVQELLDQDDQSRLKDLVRDPETEKVKTQVFAEAFSELMSEGGLGN